MSETPRSDGRGPAAVHTGGGLFTGATASGAQGGGTAAAAASTAAIASGAAAAAVASAVAASAVAATTATSAAVTPAVTPADPEGARQRLALGQTALLSALVAGTPLPEGFDRSRAVVQSRALAAKRVDVVAAVAPELPAILGDDFRSAFLRYAAGRPMGGGYRRDALDFVEHVLSTGAGSRDMPTRRIRDDLSAWWFERCGPEPPPTRRGRARMLGRRLNGAVLRRARERPA